ncbi:MAG: flippase-like domain-containing protein [Deltaproteobacteria bacterium]|nr:flippase-like domain-containing protein [Deltaproteobacteria bacterium]
MRTLIRRLLLVMLLAIAVYGGLVLYRGVDLISAQFANYHWWTFAAACGLAFANYLLRFLKWEYYLAKLEIRGVPKGESFLTFLSGFVLTVTPGKVGEVFKSFLLHETRGISMVRTAPIVVAERVTDLIGVIVLIAVGSASFDGGVVWAAAGAIVVALVLVFITSERLSRAVVDVLPRLPSALGRVGARIQPKLLQALAQLRVLTTPRRLVWPTMLSVVGWSLEGVGLWIILGGFEHQAPLAMTTFFYATATLAGALVPVPGGLGVTEKVLEEGMEGIGHVPEAIATGSMLLVRFATLWFAVAVGFVALALLRRRYPKLLAAHAELEARGESTEETRDESTEERSTRNNASGAG